MKKNISGDYLFKFNLENLRGIDQENFLPLEPMKGLFAIYLNILLG
jgi:hypothetical protein